MVSNKVAGHVKVMNSHSRVQVEFMRRHSFAYEALAGEEYQGLKADLVKVQESVGNFAFAAEIKQPTSKDTFFKARTPQRFYIQCHLYCC